MEKQKWFYPLQEEVNSQLKEKYSYYYRTAQIVTKNTVIELVHAVNKEGINTILQLTMNKSDNSIVSHELKTLAIFF